jgi:hypothetical protein
MIELWSPACEEEEDEEEEEADESVFSFDDDMDVAPDEIMQTCVLL